MKRSPSLTAATAVAIAATRTETSCLFLNVGPSPGSASSGRPNNCAEHSDTTGVPSDSHRRAAIDQFCTDSIRYCPSGCEASAWASIAASSARVWLKSSCGYSIFGTFTTPRW